MFRLAGFACVIGLCLTLGLCSLPARAYAAIDDADGDGWSDAQECPDPSACPDNDGDGLANQLDTDSDNDAVHDNREASAAARVDPCLPTTIAAACTTGDADADGLSNATECSRALACPDTDGDGTNNYLDTDSDNDGVSDNAEANAAAAINPCAPSNTGVYCATGDSDGDGVNNGTECQDPLGSCADSDGDGAYDYLDTDADNDGVADGGDIGRTNACAPSTAVARCLSGDADSDGVPNGSECSNPADCADTDADGTSDFRDNDADGDGTGDSSDPARTDPCVPSRAAPRCASGDADGDSLSNSAECPNAGACRDSDGDAVPDFLDRDADADGTIDLLDEAPTDPCVPNTTVVVCARGDTDGDGLSNGSECPRPDACPDTDGDGTADHRDLDSDNDGANDQTDSALIDPCAPNNQVAACSSGDPDRDGVQNARECTSSFACPDSDGDGTADYLDTDSDGDGAPDNGDAARVEPCTPMTRVLACASGDFDSDGFSNAVECPYSARCPDSDRDGTPDYRDVDSDDDGVADGGDPGRLDPCQPSSDVPVCGTGDADKDGVRNSSECADPALCVDTDRDGAPDYQDTDSDNDAVSDAADTGTVDPCSPNSDAARCVRGDADRDGVGNGAECPNPAACADSDGDATPDYQDTDSDNDGLADVDDAARMDPCAPAATAAACSGGDSDGDGVVNAAECPDPRACADHDEDGMPDVHDADSDNDGTPDGADDNSREPCLPAPHAAACGGGDADADGIGNAAECPDPRACPDTDRDGTPDFRDSDADGDGALDQQDSTPLDPCQPRADAAACGVGDPDGDGLRNGAECEDPRACADTDGDGTPDYRDADADSDRRRARGTGRTRVKKTPSDALTW